MSGQRRRSRGESFSSMERDREEELSKGKVQKIEEELFCNSPSNTEKTKMAPIEIPSYRKIILYGKRKRWGLVSACTLVPLAVVINSSLAYSPASLMVPSRLDANHQFVMKTCLPSTTMFIQNSNTCTRPLVSLSSPGPPPAVLERGNMLIVRNNGRDRGVLGFHVGNDEKSTRTYLESRSTQHDDAVSNLDANTWNMAQPLYLDDDSSSSSPSLRRRVPLFPGLYEDAMIPSSGLVKVGNRDINLLTVAQLKVELGVRGLKKTGNKKDLQERLRNWLRENDESDDDALLDRRKSDTTVNSLAEWGRTVDLEPLMQRRKAIHREKLRGKKKKEKGVDTSVIPADYRSVLKKVFDRPSSPYSNWEVKQMYGAAKAADQMGDAALSKRILLELKKATPHDARLYSRLARLEKERGNMAGARAVLEEGLELHAENAFLWHALGQLEGSVGDIERQKTCLLKAIEVDPTIPHPHHALGTLEHTQGEIAQAMKVLKQGIEYCPKNHRLHHALGDIYRDAKMLDMATGSYRKAIQYGPSVSHGFAYTALSYVAYEQGKVATCRHWLHRAVELNHGRQANAWVALAQMEESEGNIDVAREACMASISKYERGLLKKTRKLSSQPLDHQPVLNDPIATKNNILKQVPRYRSGDRFFNVYRTWLRLEERYGSMEAFDEVYKRASAAFPQQWKLSVDSAEYYARRGEQDRARVCFSEACGRAGSHHADPFRLFAAYEMSRKNYAMARQILYTGALNLADNKESDLGNRRGLAELFYTWGVCEWHLGCYQQASALFSYALEELSPTGEHTSRLRSFLLFVVARFEFDRKEYRRAQHFLRLCLHEGDIPGGVEQVWRLWERIAADTGDRRLAARCRDQGRAAAVDNQCSGASPLHNSDLKSMVRRDPWHHRLFGPGNDLDAFFSTAHLPDELDKEVSMWEESEPSVLGPL